MATPFLLYEVQYFEKYLFSCPRNIIGTENKSHLASA